jgi:hypothetical protein
MQLATFVVKGKADYFGTPVANAKVTLFDAISGEPAKVIAAGGGNYVVSANTRSFVQVASASFSTDENGEFLITYQGPANAKGEGLPVRVVVENKPTPAAQRHVQNVMFEDLHLGTIVFQKAVEAQDWFANHDVLKSKLQTVPVNPPSTVALQNSFGVLSIMKSLKIDAAVDVSYGYLVELGKLTKTIEEKITKADFETFATSLDATGKLTDDKALRTWLSDKGIATAMDTTATAGMKSVAEKFADKNNVVQKIDVSGDDFVGSNFNIQIQDGQLVVVNSVTGEATSFNLDAGTDGGVDNSNTNVDPTQQDGVEEDPNLTGNPDDAPVFSSASFNPSVTVSKGGSLTITVDQPTGSDDIAAIFARVKKADASGSFFSGSHTLTADAVDSKVTVTKTNQTLGLTLVQDNTLNYSAQAGPRFSNITLKNPMWQGWLQTSGGVHVAKFGVFEPNPSDGYYYLVTSYQLNNNAITTSSGHHTVLKTNDAALSASAKAEISIVSRRSALVERTN